jgi:hypothetical protein
MPERLDLRHGGEVVLPGEVEQPLDVSLLIGPPDQAELRLQEIMTL